MGLRALCLILLQLSCAGVWADASDDDLQKALKQTQEMLRSSSQRQEAIAHDPKAKEMDDKVGALAGSSGTKDDMYELSAQLMKKVYEESKGDPEAMNRMAAEMQKDPKGAYEKYFNAEQKAKVEVIADKIGKQPASVSGAK
jgi:hypothetical protein